MNIRCDNICKFRTVMRLLVAFIKPTFKKTASKGLRIFNCAYVA